MLSLELPPKLPTAKETGLEPGQNMEIAEMNGVTISILIVCPTPFLPEGGQTVAGQGVVVASRLHAAEAVPAAVNVSRVVFGSSPKPAFRITDATVPAVVAGPIFTWHEFPPKVGSQFWPCTIAYRTPSFT